MSTSGRGGRGRGSRPAEENQQTRRPGLDGSTQPVDSSAGGGRGATRSTADRQPSGSSGVRNEEQAVRVRGVSRPPNDSQGPTTIRTGFIKHGEIGQKIRVQANYFELIKRPDMHLLQYHVTFTPEIDICMVQKALIRQHENLLGKHVFDGMHLYTVRRLSQPLELTSKRLDGSIVTITPRLTREVQSNDPDYRTVLNIIFRQCLAMLNLVMMRRDYFDPVAQTTVTERNHTVRVWPGYRTTIDRYEEGSLLNVEIIHKFLRHEKAIDVMNLIRRSNPDDIQNRVKAEMVGKIVMTAYNNKTYRVDDVDFDKNVLSTFHVKRSDRNVSYLDFYKERYGITIGNVTQPLLATRPSRRDLNRGDTELVYLIPELCLMTGLSDEQRGNFHLTKAISNVTRVPPGTRVANLMRFRQRLIDNASIQGVFKSWGLQLSDELVSCTGRVLPTRDIQLGNGQNFPVREGNWSGAMQRAKMILPVKLDSWIVIFPDYLAQKVRNFVTLIIRVGQAQGVNILHPKYVALRTDRVNSYNEAISRELSQTSYNIVMCVLKSTQAVTYSNIKIMTLCRNAIPSQVITGKILDKNEQTLLSIATKVMTQMACKIGAQPWTVNLPKKAWMIVGYDTYHDARQRRAVGAFVATTNEAYTRFHSSVKKHEANEEISPSFRDHTLTCLKAYRRANNYLPENIIVYRDGIGTGDVQRVIDIEVQGIEQACREAAELFPGFKPGIAFIVVSKRINTRFFNTRVSNGVRVTDNPPCGTVVDNKVTYDNRFDFFLVSQKVNHATVSPTNYNVIYDTATLTADAHQNMAYGLTQLYYNWAGTLRVPAPVQYAHKLAYLVGEHLGTLPNDIPAESLATLPYYL